MSATVKTVFLNDHFMKTTGSNPFYTSIRLFFVLLNVLFTKKCLFLSLNNIYIIFWQHDLRLCTC